MIKPTLYWMGKGLYCERGERIWTAQRVFSTKMPLQMLYFGKPEDFTNIFLVEVNVIDVNKIIANVCFSLDLPVASCYSGLSPFQFERLRTLAQQLGLAHSYTENKRKIRAFRPAQTVYTLAAPFTDNLMDRCIL